MKPVLINPEATQATPPSSAPVASKISQWPPAKQESNDLIEKNQTEQTSQTRAAKSSGGLAPEKPAEPGFPLLVEILRHKRIKRRLSHSRVAALAGVPIQSIEDLEAFGIHKIGLGDLIKIAKALGSELSVQIGPRRPKLPKTQKRILAEFDQLIKKGRCNVFFKEQPDKEHAGVLWDVVGDVKRNLLFVVASNPTKKVRFAKVTDDPGGWAIGGQMFGIDVETQAIADELSEKLLADHRAELI